METQALNKYLDGVWSVVAEANRYFAGEEPWTKKKTDFKRMETILYVTAEVVRQVAILAQPVMSGSTGKLLNLLRVADGARGFDQLGEAGRLSPGVELPAPTGVFPRYIEPEELERRRAQAAKPGAMTGSSKA